MKIMTWNVDWYRNGEYSGKHPGEYLEKDIKKDVKEKIEGNIQEFLQGEDAIVFLQEIPNFSKPPMIEVEGCKPIYYKQDANMHTIAISKDQWKNKTTSFFGESKDYFNRIVVVERDDIKLVGVHIPDLRRQPPKEKEDVKKLWRRLIKFCAGYNPDVICGDFNTDCEYDNNERCDQFYYLEELKNRCDYWEAQGSATRNKPNKNPTTTYGTHIDYILVKKRIKTLSYEIGKQKLSDHFPLIAEVDI